jgi:hypothetical protein
MHGIHHPAILIVVLVVMALASQGCASGRAAGAMATHPADSLGADGATETAWPLKESIPTNIEVHLMGAEEAASAPAGMVTVTAEEMAITDKATLIKVVAMHPFDGLEHEGWTEAEIQMLHDALIRNGHALLCCDR